MGIELYNCDGSVQMANQLWRETLKMAMKYSWVPLGTTLDENRLKYLVDTREEIEAIVQEWDGRYTGNEHQIISLEDANRLSDALLLAVEDDFYETLEDKAWLVGLAWYLRGSETQIG